MAEPTFASNSDLIRYWWRKVWEEGDEAVIYKYCDTGAEAKGLGDREGAFDVEGFVAFQRAMLALLSDIEVDVKLVTEEGDWVVSWVTFSGSCRKTGKRVSFDGSGFTRIENGLAVEGHNHFDFGVLFEQLGLMPEGWMATCLGGECLG